MAFNTSQNNMVMKDKNRKQKISKKRRIVIKVQKQRRIFFRSLYNHVSIDNKMGIKRMHCFNGGRDVFLYHVKENIIIAYFPN